jgi:2-polyprenyl-6-methoxyphenol hydroxylase-like FAD-dependent oxidoreductase
MFKSQNPEVLIAGAGPVGLFTALALTRRGVRVRIVDTGVWACTHSYALALHPGALRLLEEEGLLEGVIAEAYPVRRIGFYDGAERRAMVSLYRAGDHPESYMAVVRQDMLERSFERALQDLGVRVSWRHGVSGLAPEQSHVGATIDKFEKESRGYVVARTEWMVAKSIDLEPQFVVGADGYNSQVRRALNLGYPEVGPAQYYAVFEFKSDADLNHEMRVVLGGRTLDVLWPLAGGRCRWSFELPDYSDPEAEQFRERLTACGLGNFPSERLKDRLLVSTVGHLPVLEEANLKALIAERAPWFTGTIDGLTWRTMVRFERRLAASFGCGRMWLAGDAAHLTGPAGVQSMNLGLFEARDLAETVTQVLRCGGSMDLLDDYNQRWTAVWRQLHGLEGGLRPAPAADPWVAMNAKRLLVCLPGHGPALSALAWQLSLQV